MSVEDILTEMARNAGRVQLQRGQILGDVISSAANIPRQYYADQQQERNDALRRLQVQQQMQFEQARAGREDAAAQRQRNLDAKADTSANAADMKEAATKQLIAAGFADDPSTFNLAHAVTKAQEIGAEDLLPSIAAVHEKFGGPKLEAVDPEKDIIHPTTGAIIRKGTPKQKEPKTVTGPELDMAAQQLYAKKKMGMPLTPQEEADLSGYEERKRVVSDPALIGATERAAASQKFAADQQGRAQSFTEAQAGRKELTDKVEAPYQDALQKAALVKNFVEMAKSGNVVAGSLQPMVTTMATVGGEGFKRLTNVELEATGEAGSAWQRLKGSVGKLVEGQPVPPEVQRDMITLADALAKNAYSKYKDGHASVTKRYNLKDEAPLPAPSTASDKPTLSAAELIKKYGG